jgi:hypothetical protein
MVIVDRLTKGEIYIPLPTIDIETVVHAFLRYFFAEHGFPRYVTSDRGSQFTGAFWKRFCQILGVEQRLSTAYHPETDGSTERANQEVQNYVRHFCNTQQNDWDDLLPMAQQHRRAQPSAAIGGLSPFYVTHGFHARLTDGINIDPLPHTIDDVHSPTQLGELMVVRLNQALEHAKEAMDAAQARMEEDTNKHRDASFSFKIGDKVWLDTRNYLLSGPSKKFSPRHALHTVTRVISSHAYELDTEGNSEKVFHIQHLRPAATDPLPSQIQDDYRPAPLTTIDNDPEWAVESITDHRWHASRGMRKPKQQFLVKWVGYVTPTWQWLEDVNETAALDEWIKKEGGQVVWDRSMRTLRDAWESKKSLRSKKGGGRKGGGRQ